MQPMAPRHEPVMTAELIGLLAPEHGGVFLDCTVGLGGHSRALLEAGATRIIALDRDPDAIAATRESFAASRWRDRIDLLHADYRDVEAVLDSLGVSKVDGALADLGISSMQLEASGRGFSFMRDEPLDMRMDPSGGPTAADLLARASESELANVIFEHGEERHSRRIARLIVTSRQDAPVRTTGQLAAIVRRAVPRRGYTRIDPATRTFQALRIWVNRELEGLDLFLQALTRRLRAGARVVVITFHSLEDRIVKHTFRTLEHATEATVRVLTRKPVVPTASEIARNPRARSAKLRAAERLA
jgi:16S rRNA (cytosine1402-N4)-methyltransferase